jgi:hypothetical protein
VSLFFATPTFTYANAFNFSTSATIFWNTLRITTDPGVTVNWVSTQSRVSASGGSLNGPRFFLDQTINNWGDLSYSNQLGALAVTADATANSLSADIVWSDIPPSCCSALSAINRTGTFQVTGSGNVTFAVDYSIALNRLVNTLLLPPEFRFFLSDGSVGVHMSIVGNQFSDDAVFIAANTLGSASDSLSRNGTLTVQERLSDGDYSFIASAQSTMNVAASEPSSLLLLATGLAGLIAVKRFRGIGSNVH